MSHGGRPQGQLLPVTRTQSTIRYVSWAPERQRYQLAINQPAFDPAGDTGGVQCLEAYPDTVCFTLGVV